MFGTTVSSNKGTWTAPFRDPMEIELCSSDSDSDCLWSETLSPWSVSERMLPRELAPRTQPSAFVLPTFAICVSSDLKASAAEV